MNRLTAPNLALPAHKLSALQGVEGGITRLVTGAILIDGILAGASLDRTLIQLPAFRQVGPLPWAAFSRKADLGDRAFLWYPSLAMIGTGLSLAAALKGAKRNVIALRLRLAGCGSGFFGGGAAGHGRSCAEHVARSSSRRRRRRSAKFHGGVSVLAAHPRDAAGPGVRGKRSGAPCDTPRLESTRCGAQSQKGRTLPTSTCATSGRCRKICLSY